MTIELPIYQVDAFADALFAGNPAAIVPLSRWLPDAVLQNIAAENNLAETAFLVETAEGYKLRWFTPTIEVDLCGHATLAAASIVFRFLKPGSRLVRFSTQVAGILAVTEADGMLTLDFPAQPPMLIPTPAGLEAALGARPVEVWGQERVASGKLLCVFAKAEDVRRLRPDFRALAVVEGDGAIVTAPGEDRDGVDFVSRYFAPAAGIDEDPVTGSAHCVLVPYWSRRLGRKVLTARQVSARGGSLLCEDRGARVSIAGRTQLYLTGHIVLPNGTSSP